jgi:hypothetical protein
MELDDTTQIKRDLGAMSVHAKFYDVNTTFGISKTKYGNW